jgi:hypothetical protein
MSTAGQIVIYGLAAIVLAFLLFRVFIAARAYFKLRGKRLITCPENEKPAAVNVDAKHAGVEALTGIPHLRLSECSRWPERRNCGQECLKQIELAPESCLVRTIVTKWYEGKNCAICGRPIHDIDWMGHKPALLDPQQKTVHWDAVAAERLPEYFATYAPVCWDCHVAETLRHQHPELITDRPPH